MKTTLLLTNEAETTRLMLNDVAFDEIPARDTDSARGLQLRSLAAPLSGMRRPRHRTKAETPVHHQSNSEITQWNI